MMVNNFFNFIFEQKLFILVQFIENIYLYIHTKFQCSMLDTLGDKCS